MYAILSFGYVVLRETKLYIYYIRIYALYMAWKRKTRTRKYILPWVAKLATPSRIQLYGECLENSKFSVKSVYTTCKKLVDFVPPNIVFSARFRVFPYLMLFKIYSYPENASFFCAVCGGTKCGKNAV